MKKYVLVLLLSVMLTSCASHVPNSPSVTEEEHVPYNPFPQLDPRDF